MNDTFGPLFGVSRAEAATPEQADTRALVNVIAGTKRIFSHAIFTPGYDGWITAV